MSLVGADEVLELFVLEQLLRLLAEAEQRLDALHNVFLFEIHSNQK